MAMIFTDHVSIARFPASSCMQHRGQDSCGMVTTDWDKFRERKDVGMLKDVFPDSEVMDKMKGAKTIGEGQWIISASHLGFHCGDNSNLHPRSCLPHPGSCGIAHIQNMRSGGQEVQPHFVNSPLGIYLIHNGGLTNVKELQDLLSGSRSFFNRCGSILEGHCA